MVPSRPLSEEHDEEVTVHELRAEAVVLAVEDEGVRRTWPSTMDWPVLFSAL